MKTLPFVKILISFLMIIPFDYAVSVGNAATYNISSTMNISTFEEPVTNGGVSIGILSPSDILSMQGGTLAVAGNGSSYSALIGSGSGASAGFNWGTGGTFNLGSGVDLAIDTPTSSNPVNISKTGPGSLDLTSTSPLYLNISMSGGSIQTDSSVNMSQQMSMSAGTITVNGDLTAQNGSKINGGDLVVEGAYINNGTQTDIHGSLSANSATFNSGGLYIFEGGSFKTTDAVNFAVNSAIVNYGDMQVGDDSQFDATTVADLGTMTIGDGAVFTGLFANTGIVDILGSTTFFHVYNGNTINVAGDALFTGDFNFYKGTITLDETGTFQNIAMIGSGAVLDIQDDATFDNSLTVSDGSLLVGGNINAAGISTTGNSILGLSNKLTGSNLGDLVSSDTIDLSSGTTVQTDLSSLVSITQPTLLIHIVSGNSTDQFQIDGLPTDPETVAALIGSNTVLRRIYAIDTGTGYDIYANARTLGDYAQEEGLQRPAIDAGNSVDDMRDQLDPSDPVYDMVDDLYNETDQNVINQTLYNLAGGYGVENIFSMMFSHLGQAGSPYFFGKTSGNSTKDNPCLDRDQSEIQFASYYESLSASGNFFQHGFNLNRTGLIVDVRRCLSPQMSGGLLFSYDAPRLRQSGDLIGYNDQFHSKLNLDHYELAGHLEYTFENGARCSAFVGGGAWNMRIRRRAWGISANEIPMDRSFNGSTDGNTLSASVYYSLPFRWDDSWTITPMIGIDSEHAWLYAFEESSTGSGNWQEMNNLSEGNFYSPVQYRRTYYDRTTARAGICCDYEKNQKGLSLNLFYGSQIGGEDYAVVPVSTLGGAFNGTIQGFGIGRDSLNLGGGAWIDLNRLRTVTLSMNYNYFTLSNAKASNVVAALQWIY